MKKLYTLGILAALILGGCQNESIVEKLPESSIFYATIEDNSTKTSLDENRNVLWKQGDQISVFDGNTINKQYQVTDASDGKTSATLNVINGGGYVAGTELTNNVAFYPYAAGNEIAKNGAGYNISCTIPATQNYAEGSFGNGAFPMVAVSGSTSDKNLSFKNVLGGLKLQLKGTAKIASITVTGNNNEILYGAATVTAQNGNTPTIALSDASAQTVTLNCGSGVQLNTTTATVFIIALPPMTMSAGFTVIATDTQGKQMEIKSVRSQTIARSSLLKMPEVNYSGAYGYVDLGLSSGVKWAAFNVGATAPEEYGDYFTWGATEPLYEAGYAQENPQAHWKTGMSDGYCYNNTPYQTANAADYASTKWSKYLGTTASSYKDNNANDADAKKAILDTDDDAAHINWGGSWRMPTETEWEELNANCTWTWETRNGINGYKVQSKIDGYTENSIFLPAAGYREGTSLSELGKYGYYWSGMLSTVFPTHARRFYFSNSNHEYIIHYRSGGLSVRPVISDVQNYGITGVSLNKTVTSLMEGSDETLIATVSKIAGAVNTQVVWYSSDPEVATVDFSGKVTAVSKGTAVITAQTVSGGFTATCTVTVSGYEYVDLGLSVKWATFNVGATAPEGYGDYFAWGATEPFYKVGYAQNSEAVWKTGKSDGYCWNNTPYQTANTTEASSTKWKKYLGEYSSNKDASATDADSKKTVLDLTDDAARANWGGNWRMPTDKEWAELGNTDNCSWTWTTINDISGYKVQSKKTGYTDNWIFLPAAGYRDGTSMAVDELNSSGSYWSSSLYTDRPYWATYTINPTESCSLDFIFSNHYYDRSSRFFGLSVRPVCP